MPTELISITSSQHFYNLDNILVRYVYKMLWFDSSYCKVFHLGTYLQKRLIKYNFLSKHELANVFCTITQWQPLFLGHNVLISSAPDFSSRPVRVSNLQIYGNTMFTTECWQEQRLLHQLKKWSTPLISLGQMINDSQFYVGPLMIKYQFNVIFVE